MTQTTAADRRASILQHAAELFDQRGYHQSSMADIAAAVGIAKPTLYHYFGAKDEILFGIHDQFLSRLADQHRQRAQSEARPDVLLSGIVGDIVDLMKTHRGHVRAFFEHHRELPDTQRAIITRQRDAYERIVHDLIVRGQREGMFREVNVKVSALALFGAVNWTYQWYRPGSLDTRDIGAIIWDVFFRGLKSDEPVQPG